MQGSAVGVRVGLSQPETPDTRSLSSGESGLSDLILADTRRKICSRGHGFPEQADSPGSSPGLDARRLENGSSVLPNRVPNKFANDLGWV